MVPSRELAQRDHPQLGHHQHGPGHRAGDRRRPHRHRRHRTVLRRSTRLSFGAVLISLAMMRPAPSCIPRRPPGRQPGQVREGLRYVRRTPELPGPAGHDHGRRHPRLGVPGVPPADGPVHLPRLGPATYGTMLAVHGRRARWPVAWSPPAAPGSRPPASGGPRSGWGLAILAAAFAPNLPIEYAVLAAGRLREHQLQLAGQDHPPAGRGPARCAAGSWRCGRVAWLGSTPIGGPIVGWIGQSFGARWSLVVGGGATLLAGLLGYRSLIAHRPRARPRRRLGRLPRPNGPRNWSSSRCPPSPDGRLLATRSGHWDAPSASVTSPCRWPGRPRFRVSM